MSNTGLGATVAVVALVLVGVGAGALGAVELSQPSSTTTTEIATYTASLGSSLNVSIRSNLLTPGTNLTNPRAIFSNVTTSLGLSFWYRFQASQPLPVTGTLSFDERFYSGTTPSWSMLVNSSLRPLVFNSSAVSDWLPTSLNLSSIASVLNQSSAIDREFELAPGPGTLVLNASFEMELPGEAPTQNNSSVELTFDYTGVQGGGTTPAAYSAINPVYSPVASYTGQSENSNTVTSQDGTPDVYLALAAGAFVAAVLVGVLYLPRQRPSTLQRFLSENVENVVRVEADSRVHGKAVRVKDLAELVKLANLSDQPIFLFDSPKGALLYVIRGDTTFACAIPSETNQEPRVS